jgi:ectoine hydroxylase-related dioxygenase (phytanoyl-CoA dioxygenase family)
MAVITASQIREYKHNGAICIRQAIDASWIAPMLEHIDTHAATGGQDWTVEPGDRAFSDRYLWPTRDWMRAFMFESGVAEIAGRLMQSCVARGYFDHIFVRDARTPEVTPWHQDRPYWPFLGTQICSVWVALTGCELQSSGVSFVKGSHRWDKVYKPQAFSEDDPNDEWIKHAAGEDIPDFWALRDKYEFLDWAMEPGDAIVFGADVLHAAGRNQTDNRRRVAVSTRWLGDDAIWDPREGTDPIVTQEHVSIQPGELAADDRAFPVGWRADAT